MREKVDYDNKYTFDKVTAVACSGARHEVDQPHHLVVADTEICRTRCTEEYGNPCEHFCPAAVYEMVPDDDGSGKHLVIHHENCVHCKTCDIADPYADHHLDDARGRRRARLHADVKESDEANE